MLNQLFAIKPVDANAFANTGLKRVLGARQLFLLGIGAIIGAGIFVMTGTAAANYAGPGVMLSFVMAGLACAFAGLCYAEFAAMMPVSGSAYSYTYSTMGEVVAWFIGWNLVLEYLFAASTVAVGWSGYLNSFLSTFGMAFPDALSQAPYTFVAETKSFVSTGATLNLPAVLIVAAISALCYRSWASPSSSSTLRTGTPARPSPRAAACSAPNSRPSWSRPAPPTRARSP
jgi:APA family basic amino acid/polyamine antiporter